MSTARQAAIVRGLSRQGITPPSFLGALGVIGTFVLVALLAPLVLGDDPFANHFIPGGGLAHVNGRRRHSLLARMCTVRMFSSKPCLAPNARL